jgi:pyrimidine-nucleoside phosphorylase
MKTYNPVQIIQKKRDGTPLTQEEIQFFIQGLSQGKIPDYQATAFLMAVYFKGMTPTETAALTLAMRDSGERYDLSSIPGAKVDKHSTGGVGDKVSIILAPLAAACGLTVPMMAGRGLGHSGGTLDKLESIPGFRVQLNREEFETTLKSLGCSIIGQTQKIAPADRKLYALRDVTATVDCIPLIVASILSKKAAEGTKHLLLDVKVGNGAFMKTRQEARQLAVALIRTAKAMGLPTQAVLTDMNQPLGYSVGNALEVKECVEILRGLDTSPGLSSADLKELTLHLCARMLVMSKKAKTLPEGRKIATQNLENGRAYSKFKEMVQAQGGKVAAVESLDLLPTAKHQITLHSSKKGYISQMDTEAIGWMLIDLGGGRRVAEDKVDPAVGFVFHKKLGGRVNIGDPLVTIHLPDQAKSEIKTRSFWDSEINKVIRISNARPTVPKLIIGAIG